jgi:hypothetical protein
MNYALLFFTFIFYIKIGSYQGNWMVYAFQLILFFLYLVILRFIKAQRKKPVIILFSCLITIQLLWVSRLGFLHLPDYQEAKWNNLKQLLADHKNIYNSPAIVSILVEKDRKIYDSGLSDQFVKGLSRRSIWKMLFPTPKKFTERYNQFLRDINESIMSKKYDLMVFTPGLFPSYFLSKECVERYYQYQETVPSPFTYTGYNEDKWELEIWRPEITQRQWF